MPFIDFIYARRSLFFQSFLIYILRKLIDVNSMAKCQTFHTVRAALHRTQCSHFSLNITSDHSICSIQKLKAKWISFHSNVMTLVPLKCTFLWIPFELAWNNILFFRKRKSKTFTSYIVHVSILTSSSHWPTYRPIRANNDHKYEISSRLTNIMCAVCFAALFG